MGIKLYICSNFFPKKKLKTNTNSLTYRNKWGLHGKREIGGDSISKEGHNGKSYKSL
jgi:hypothetical protein